MAALLTGWRLSDDRIGLWRALGFVHVTSFAGIHLYGLWFFFERLGRLLQYSSRVTPRIVARSRRVVPRLFVGSSLLILLLSGFRWGLLRPLLTVAARLSVRIHGGRFAPWSLWFVVAVVDLLVQGAIDSFRAEQTGFSGALHYWLALAGGALAIRHSKERAKRPEKKADVLCLHLRLSLGSWLLTAVLDAFTVYRIAWLTPVLSFLTVPYFALVAVPMSLLAIVTGSTFPWFFEFHTNALALLARLSVLPATLWFVSVRDLATGLAVLVALKMTLYFVFRSRSQSTWPFVTIAVLGAALGLWVRLNVASYAAPHVTPNVAFEARAVVQLDVGQGDSALVIGTDRRKIPRSGLSAGWLIDVGSDRSTTPVRWLDRMARYKQSYVSGVILSHDDEDHRGGWNDLHQVAAIESRCDRHTLHCDVPAGFHLFRQEPPTWQRSERNAAMIGTLISLPGATAWIGLGDAGAELEEKWIPEIQTILKEKQVTKVFLKISHHGSKTSTSLQLLNVVRPHEAWISSGARNRYGHPHQSVLQRLRVLRVPVRRTDQEGDIFRLEPVVDAETEASG